MIVNHGLGDTSIWEELGMDLNGYFQAFGSPMYAIGPMLASNEIINAASPAQQQAMLETMSGMNTADYQTLGNAIDYVGSAVGGISTTPVWLWVAVGLAGLYLWKS